MRRPSWPDPGSAAVAAGIAERTADGSVVFRLPVEGPPEPDPVGAAPPTAVQTLGEDAATAGPAAVPTPTPVAPAEGATGGQDLDTLARKLTPLIGRLLKAELRRDRERLGRAVDLTH